MSEIKTSAKGVDYADPCTLQIKKRVYSQALLMRIPHDHTDVQDISLKIGRYNIPYGLESKKPKSELTLHNEELDALIRYNKALLQRNTLLKAEVEPDDELMSVWEEMMAQAGEAVYRKRYEFIMEFIPVFQSFYSFISKDGEQVSLQYQSHVAQGEFLQQLKEVRQRDRILGYTSRGVHKDDLLMSLGEFPIKREGSQGQNKTYLIALKLAQFEFLKRTGSRTTPIVLLDDIFDKLDASRVEQIVKLVSGDSFGQIFITDTNRDHLDRILHEVNGDYRLFEVENGEVTLRAEEKGGEL